MLVSTRNARNKIIMNLQPAIHPFSLTCPHEGCVEAETESEPKNLRAHEKQNNAPQKACVCVYPQTMGTEARSQSGELLVLAALAPEFRALVVWAVLIPARTEQDQMA